jgi:DNA excision repair protein ERCC-2
MHRTKLGMRKKKLHLSVNDLLVDPAPRGNIDEPGDGITGDPDLGAQLHEILQARWRKAINGYRTEVPVNRTVQIDEWMITVSGRIDGLHPDGSIDEIKSTKQPRRLLRALESNREHPYWLQLASYRWINGEQESSTDRLVVIDAQDENANGTVTSIGLPWSFAEFEAWVTDRLEAIVNREIERRTFIARQRKLARRIHFPFEKIRAGQQDFMEAAGTTLDARGRLIVQAPTGTGKSLGSLYPALKHALAAGTRVVFLTPKNSQFTVATQSIKRIADHGRLRLRAMTLSAKSKLCLNDSVTCTPSSCKFARGHYDRVAASGLLSRAWRRPVLGIDQIKAIGRKHEVCPYYLSLQLLPRCDVMIGDFNQAFLPESNLRKKLSNADLEAPRPVVLIDEAHNLADRVRDLWSTSISTSDANDTKWHSALSKILDGHSGGMRQIKALPDIDRLEVLRQKILEEIIDTSENEKPADDRIIHLFFKLCRFVSLLNIANEKDQFLIRHSDENEWEIHCLDPAIYLKEKYDDFSSVIAFSATLKPLDFYRNETGMDQPADKSMEVPSPFVPSNQKTIVIPQVSTMFRERERNLDKIAEAILRIISIKSGHYIAFFPSFSFLQSTAEEIHHCRKKISGSPEIEILEQFPAQSQETTRAILRRLQCASKTSTLLLLAVQGGAFAEGVDLPGNQLIGAFIIGPALPAVSPVREKMKEYFQSKYGSGFDYAYTYPGMAKSVQAAGRVIRTETDRGIVVFMDRRFLSPAHLSSIPTQWTENWEEARKGSSLMASITNFWAERTENPPIDV